MKNKKGFTLIELLVTIALMLSILGIAIVSFINISNRKKEQSWEKVKEQTELAAEEYYKTNEYYLESLTTEGGFARISIGKLVEEDFLNKTVNPLNGKTLNSCDYVEVTKKTSGYLYKYVENKNNSICNVGNYSVVSKPGAPLVSVSLTKAPTGKNNYYINDVEIKAMVSTNENGPIEEVKYCSTASDSINCKNYKNLTVKTGKVNDYYGTNYSVNSNPSGVDGNKVTTIFTVTNTSGNSISGEVTYKKDSEKPVCGTNNGSTTWVKDKRTITQNCTDKTSGCTKDKYTNLFDKTIKEGNIKIEDKAGNTNNCKVNAYVDADKPVCGETSGEGTTSNWTNKDRKISQKCSDIGSGCEKDFFVETFDKEAKTGTITIKDKVGHTRNCSVGVYIDKTKPSCTNILKLKNKSGSNYKSGNWATVPVYTSSNCSDSLSGCSGTKKITTTGDTTNVTKAANKEWTVYADGTSYTTWYVYDKAGNESACSTSTIKKESSVTLTFDYNTTNNATATDKRAKGAKVFNSNYDVIKYGSGTSGNCRRNQDGKDVGCATDDGADKYYFGKSCMNIGDFIRSFNTNSVSGLKKVSYGGNDGDGSTGLIHTSKLYKQSPTSVFDSIYRVNDLNKKNSNVNFTIHEIYYKSPAGNVSNKVYLYTEYSVDCGYN